MDAIAMSRGACRAREEGEDRALLAGEWPPARMEDWPRIADARDAAFANGAAARSVEAAYDRAMPNENGVARDPTPEDVEKLVALLRRTLKRLSVVERRLASIEERLHWLDDLPEEVQALEGLARRTASAAIDEKALTQRVMNRVTNVVNKRLGVTS